MKDPAHAVQKRGVPHSTDPPAKNQPSSPHRPGYRAPPTALGPPRHFHTPAHALCTSTPQSLPSFCGHPPATYPWSPMTSIQVHLHLSKVSQRPILRHTRPYSKSQYDLSPVAKKIEKTRFQALIHPAKQNRNTKKQQAIVLSVLLYTKESGAATPLMGTTLSTPSQGMYPPKKEERPSRARLFRFPPLSCSRTTFFLGTIGDSLRSPKNGGVERSLPQPR